MHVFHWRPTLVPRIMSGSYGYASQLPVASVLLCLGLCLLYIGSLYFVEDLLPDTRGGESWWKMAGLLVASLISILVALACLHWFPPPQPNSLDASQILGLSFRLDSIWWDFLLPCLITVLLLAPLILANISTSLDELIREEKRSIWSATIVHFTRSIPHKILESVKSLVLLKPALHQSLIFGPLAEELTYRAGFIGILRLLGGWGSWSSNLISAVMFSISHAHRSIVSHGGLNFQVLADSFIQCSFTFLFGMYSGFLFVRSRCVWTCFVAHVLCNLIGFPDIDGVLRLPGAILLLIGLVAGLSTSYAIYLLRLL